MQVEQWVGDAGEERVGPCWEELRFIRQAVAYLVLHAKQKKTLQARITSSLCALSGLHLWCAWVFMPAARQAVAYLVHHAKQRRMLQAN